MLIDFGDEILVVEFVVVRDEDEEKEFGRR